MIQHRTDYDQQCWTFQGLYRNSPNRRTYVASLAFEYTSLRIGRPWVDSGGGYFMRGAIARGAAIGADSRFRKATLYRGLKPAETPSRGRASNVCLEKRRRPTVGVRYDAGRLNRGLGRGPGFEPGASRSRTVL